MPAKRKRRINNSITEGKLGASLWKLAMPMMAGALLQNLFTLTDLFFVGRLGYVAVGALTIAGVVISIIMMLSMGISAGTTALIAHFTGKKDYGSADKVLFQTVIISVVCSLATVLAGIFGRYFLLRLFGATEEVIPAASEYIRIVFTFSITIFLFIGFNQALRGSGDAVTPLKILLFANVLNIVLDPLFIFGIGFFPRLGVAGSAIATVISRGAGVFILFMHFIFGDSSLHFKRGVFRINIPLVARMVKIGFFTSFEVMLRQISILLLWRLIASFGTASIAATGIVMQIRMAVMMVGFGMGAAASVLIGQNMGASQPARAGKSGWKALKYYEFIVIPSAMICFIFSGHIINIFTHNPEVIRTGSNFLRFIAVTLPFLASSIALARGISGAGDTIAPAIATGIAHLGIRISVAYLLVLVFRVGIDGIWLGINFSDICHGLMMILYFKSGRWKKRYYKHRAILEEQGFVGVT